MLLQQLQTYLKGHHRVSMQEIEQQFHMDAAALRGMLDQLIRKGRVHKTSGSKCAHCSSCAPEAMEFYEWTHTGEIHAIANHDCPVKSTN